MKSVLIGLAALLCLQSNAAKIAIIDSGVDYKHVQLAPHMWTNPNNPVQTKTADGKLYQNDLHGWNFANENDQIIDYKYLGTFSSDCRKMFEVQGHLLIGIATDAEKAWARAKKKDPHFRQELEIFSNFVHGTHVSGIASAESPGAELIAMKIIPTAPRHSARDRADGPSTEVQSILKEIAKEQAAQLAVVGRYVKAVKSDVANGSFGMSVPAVQSAVGGLLKQVLGHEATSQEMKDYASYLVAQAVVESKAFVGAAPDTLFVFAAGNDGTDNDSLPTSPANIKAPNTISVAATLGQTALAVFSSYGAKMVDIAAPGVLIDSTIPGDDHLAMSGTSMAAPYVTNVAGLIKDANPALTPAQIKQILMRTADVKSFLKGKVASSGIVNKPRAVRAAALSLAMGVGAAIMEANNEVRDVPETVAWTRGQEYVAVLPLPSLPF